MGEVIGMRAARKARDRAAREAEAANNRARFGRTRAEREAEAAEAARRTAVLDGARRDRVGRDRSGAFDAGPPDDGNT